MSNVCNVTLLLAVTLVISASASIDLATCGVFKGCLYLPENCVSTQCKHVVSWQTSPDGDNSKIRFEMATSTTPIDGKAVDYIAFGITPNSSSIMTNTSVLVCAKNSSSPTTYLSLNRNHASHPLPGTSLRTGLTMISSTVSSDFLHCVVDRDVQPSKAQTGLAFPLNSPWLPAIAVGPNGENGFLGHHTMKELFSRKVYLSEKLDGTSIDLSTCGRRKGCITSPEGCKTLTECSHLVTWTPVPGDEYVRFEMATTVNFTYVAFGLSGNDSADGFMGNGNVLACSYNSSSLKVQVFNSHNSNYNNKPLDRLELGIRPISLVRTDSHLICIVDRAIKPDPSIAREVFPLDKSLYVAWSSGKSDKIGHLTYHGPNKRKYDNPVVVTRGVSPPETDKSNPISPGFNFSSCGDTKGCYYSPQNCNESIECGQVVTWTVSPDDPSMVRFEMATKISNEVHYIAFGLTVSENSEMKNTSVLVCAFNETSSAATAYLSHNADYKSTPLPHDIYQVGLKLIRGELRNSTLLCIVDRKMQPTEAQAGLVFPLYMPFLPLVAYGPTDSKGILQHHKKAVKLPGGSMTVTDFTSQTSLDVSMCGISKSCLVNPPGCQSFSDCEQVVMWHPLQSGDTVRFELATLSKHDFIAFGLAAHSDISFMKNGSILACALNESKLNAFHGHNSETNGNFGDALAPQPYLGIEPMMMVSSGSHLMCVVDKAVTPDPTQIGKVFPLDQPWYPAWSTGATADGYLTYHGKNKQKYDTQVICTKSSFDIKSSNTDLLKALHGSFMSVGWMLFVASSILTPRYLRKYWSDFEVFNVQFWFFVHRGMMLAGILLVATGLGLIFGAQHFSFVLLHGETYQTLHPIFGLTACILLFSNPIISLFRCKLDDPRRRIFNWIHGMVGGLAFLLAAVNLVFGGLIFKSIMGSSAVYVTFAWVGLHCVVELSFLFIWLAERRQTDPDLSPLANPDDEQEDNPDNSRIIQKPIPMASLGRMSTGLFVVYISIDTILVIFAVVLLVISIFD